MTNKTVNSNSKEIIKGISYGESCSVSLPDGIKAVCVTAESSVGNIEALNGEIRASVKTVFKVITESEGNYDVYTFGAESVRSIFSENIVGSTKAVLNATVSDCEFSAGRATATVEISGWVLNESVLNYLDSAMDGVLCRTETVSVENIASLSFANINLTHSNEARMPLKKILDVNCSAVINNAYPSNGTYQTEGELITKITALTDNDQFLSQTFSHPFSTETAEEFCRPDSTVDVDAVVVKCEVTLADGDTRTFVSDTEIQFRTTISEKFEIQGITDCYSISNETEKSFSSTKLDRCFCYRTVRDKINSVIKTEGLINEVFCVLSPSVNASAVPSDGGLAVEGLISATVLYADENNAIKTVLAEIPFVTDIDRSYDCDVHLQPTVNVFQVSARLRTGMEMEISAEFGVTVRGVAESSATLVSEVTVGAEKEENDFAISLYIVKPGENLWDVAKALNTDEQTLLKLNADIKIPLTGGEKILIYKELNFAI